MVARLTKDKHVYHLDPNAEPAIVIASGEELLVETWDAFEGGRDPDTIRRMGIRGAATGPIYVEGAAPGDALKIDFIGIRAVVESVHLVSPERGFLQEDFLGKRSPSCLSRVIRSFSQGESSFPCDPRSDS
jgi:amidase